MTVSEPHTATEHQKPTPNPPPPPLATSDSRNTHLHPDTEPSTHDNPIPAKKAIHDGAAELLQQYHPYMIESDTCLNDVRRRLSAAIQQTRELRMLFTNRVQDKFHIPLPQVPALEDILTQCRAPGASDRLKWEMSFISSNSGSSKRHPESRLLKSLLLAGHNIPTTGMVSLAGEKQTVIQSRHIVQPSATSTAPAIKTDRVEAVQVEQQVMKRRALHLSAGMVQRQGSAATARVAVAAGNGATKKSMAYGMLSGTTSPAEAAIFRQYPTLKRTKRSTAIEVMRTEDAMTSRARESVRQIANIMLNKKQKLDGNQFELEYNVLKDEKMFQELCKLSAQLTKTNKKDSSMIQQSDKKNDEKKCMPLNHHSTKEINPLLSFSVFYALGIISRPTPDNTNNKPLSDSIRRELNRETISNQFSSSFLSNFVEPKPKRARADPSIEFPVKKVTTTELSALGKDNKTGIDSNVTKSASQSKDLQKPETKSNSNEQTIKPILQRESMKSNLQEPCYLPKKHIPRQQQQQQQHLHPIPPTITSNFNNSTPYRDNRTTTYNSIHQHSDLHPPCQNYMPQHVQLNQQSDQFSTPPTMTRQQLSRASSNQSETFHNSFHHHQTYPTQNSIQVSNHYIVNGSRAHSSWNQNAPQQPTLTVQNSYDVGYSSMFSGQPNSQIYHPSPQYRGNNFSNPVSYTTHVGRQDLVHASSTMPAFNSNVNGRRDSAVRFNDVYDPRSVTVAQSNFHQQPPQSVFYTNQISHNNMQCPGPNPDLHQCQQAFTTVTREGVSKNAASFQSKNDSADSKVAISASSTHSSNSLKRTASENNAIIALNTRDATNSITEDKKIYKMKTEKSITNTHKVNGEVETIPLLIFDVPKPPLGLSSESAKLVISAQFYEVKPDEKSLALEYLLTALKSVPIPSNLILKPLREKLGKLIVSKEVVTAVALLWLWKEHHEKFQNVYQKGIRYEKDIGCRRLISMVIESCTRIIYEAERLKRFDNASTNEMAATLIAKALGSTLFICRQSDEILPHISEYIKGLDRLREKALKLQCQEKVYLANLIARQLCMSESFSKAYVSFIVTSGDILGHEELAELVQDEDLLVSSLLVHDVILNGVGKAWEDPGRPTLGFTPGLLGIDLIRRAHARAQLQRSLYSHQRARNIGGGTPNAGIYGDGPCPTTSLLSPPIRGIKRKGDNMDLDLNSVSSHNLFPAHNCISLELDKDSMKDTPYGFHDSSHFMEAYKQSFNLSCVKDIFNTESDNGFISQINLEANYDNGTQIKAYPSTQPIEWEEVTSQFISVSVNDHNQATTGDFSPKPILPIKKTTCESLNSCIFSPSVKILDRKQIEGILSDGECGAPSSEDISDAAIIERHQVVLKDMKQKLDRSVEAKKNRCRAVPSH